MKISESLEYLTQIHKSWNGTEQRAALRKNPRRGLAYDYIGTNTNESAYLRALSYAKQTQKIEFPAWHVADVLPRYRFFNGATQFQLNPASIWGYRGAGSCVFYYNDEYGGDRYALNYVASNGMIGIKKPFPGLKLGNNLPVIVPVFWGVLKQEESYSNITSVAAEMTLNVELFEDYGAPSFPEAFDMFHPEPEEWNYGFDLPAQYEGIDLFRRPPSWNGDCKASFKRNVARLDNKSGVFTYDVRSIASSESREIEFQHTSRQEINNFQRFFCRQYGQLKSFYMPSWMADAELAQDAAAGDSILFVKWPRYYQYYSQAQRRRRLVIFYKDGTTQIVKIGGFSMSDDLTKGKIYLDTDLTKPVTAQNVAMISFLVRCRFGSDILLTDYETQIAGSNTVSFVEVDA